MKNPYSIGFGKIPTQYINRDIIIDEIVDIFSGDEPSQQAVKLTGMRGTGKTVTLTALERRFEQEKGWIVVGLKSNSELREDLVAKLYSSVSFITTFIDKEVNLSAFGIGVNISDKSPVASIDFALEEIMKLVKKRGKKVLVTIDEARNTEAMVDFIQEFQILIRKDLPIFLIAAGLYEDIESIENTDGLTFFLRTEKYEMKPLSLKIIKEDYKEVLNISDEVAEQMARITKGYAFAFQALGKYMWDTKSTAVNDKILAYFDQALAEKVYEKVWSELAQSDKDYLQFFSQKEQMPVSDLLELTGKKHNEWSKSRKRLKDKGIIDVSLRGQIKLALPRFGEFIKDISEEA
ncbi:MAG: ATP-binding protein [Lachnospiraceae bacterium]|nr:ATP-binding protein [Lachnospiraceae bacterium]